MIYSDFFPNDLFINREGGVEPDIHPSALINGLIDCQGKVTIGKDVFTGHGIKILTGEHDYTKRGPERTTTSFQKPVTIKDGVWLATGCIILPGVTIGEYSVIGAGSVVTHDVPANQLWAGNPAKFIKNI